MVKPRVAARFAAVLLRRVLWIFQLPLAGLLEKFNILMRQPSFYPRHPCFCFHDYSPSKTFAEYAPKASLTKSLCRRLPNTTALFMAPKYAFARSMSA